ncbi:uncharacterized protein LOC133300773 [Gastrolobium bilobum]|uniref:uncharacterized protein LOC133300773 n=1 Tax=Gastrolobium bilobum TaxID=150636 RepID=UPI002AB30522|nr:uncharacterized protein LOC133300773 [Gastrolobium bilobum]
METPPLSDSEQHPPSSQNPPPPPNIVINQDHSSLPLTVILDDTNYPLWSQLMDMRIGARNKSGFLTGAAKKPPPSDPTYDAWVTDNKRVKSWLIDAMNPGSMQRFIRLDTASEIWDAAARTFYDGSDESCLFDLNQRSFSTKQSGRPLSIYFNELLSLFQEIDHRSQSSSATVEGIISDHSAFSRLRVHIFLAGLDSEFDQVRGKFFGRTPN